MLASRLAPGHGGGAHRRREARVRRHAAGTATEACTASELRRARSAPSARASAPNGWPFLWAGVLSRARCDASVGTGTGSLRV